jgi:hypothetical protein
VRKGLFLSFSLPSEYPITQTADEEESIIYMAHYSEYVRTKEFPFFHHSFLPFSSLNLLNFITLLPVFSLPSHCSLCLLCLVHCTQCPP